MSFGGKSDQTNNYAIPGDGWPDLSTDEFRALRRIPHTFNVDSMKAAVTIASLDIQKKLKSLVIDGKPPSFSFAETMLYKAQYTVWRIQNYCLSSQHRIGEMREATPQ